MHCFKRGLLKSSRDGPSDMLLWLGTLPSQGRIFKALSIRTNFWVKLLANAVAPTPWMYADLAASLSKKYTTGDPDKKRLQAYVASNKGSTSSSYIGCLDSMTNSPTRVSFSQSPKHSSATPLGLMRTPPTVAG